MTKQRTIAAETAGYMLSEDCVLLRRWGYTEESGMRLRRRSLRAAVAKVSVKVPPFLKPTVLSMLLHYCP
jgi:hypothetical protein